MREVTYKIYIIVAAIYDDLVETHKDARTGAHVCLEGEIQATITV